MSYTEFVKSEFIVRAFKHMAVRLTFEETERPVAIQIYGEDPDEILEAALRLQEKNPDVIDINMGCPAKTVVNRGAGVGLMRTPLKVARIFRRLSSRLEVPVSAKIRLGWEDAPTYCLIARIVEDNGGALIAVHGRTKEQNFSGQSDWDAIAEVRSAVKIPVIGNGDIQTVTDIERMKKHTGCAAVMIGRAAVGNPWIFSGLDRTQVSPDQVLQVIHQHLEKQIAFYGPNKGLTLFRKHAIRYLSLLHLPRATHTQILLQNNVSDFLSLLDKTFDRLAKT